LCGARTGWSQPANPPQGPQFATVPLDDEVPAAPRAGGHTKTDS